jgi:hypothetical protein
MVRAVGAIAMMTAAAIALLPSAIAGEPRPFEFQLEQTVGHRGLAVQGYVYNPLPWRITNVRLQVDSLDEKGTPIASASGWVQGDVRAGDRGYFYVPIAAPAPAYRASVQHYDKVMIEGPQAP